MTKKKETLVASESHAKVTEYRKKISETITPPNKIKKRESFEYLEEGYMRSRLNEHYPIWSWEPPASDPIHFLGSEWIIVTGILVVEEPNGQVTKFMSPGAARIQFKSKQPHTPENLIDLDKNVASANTFAFKRAINRKCHIGDDVYRKQEVDLSMEEAAIIKEKMVAAEFDENTIARIQKSINSGSVNKLNVPELEQWIKEQTNKEAK
tara:strand:- start:648 stop:1274 length:627 start_codon:yes stop_codon:yes gene_type:complete